MPETLRIPVDLAERSYEILLGDGILNKVVESFSGFPESTKLMIIFDESVEKPWFEDLKKRLGDSGFEICHFRVPSGEASKLPAMLAEIWEACAEENMTRDSMVVALGGGVIGDLAGFVAGSFLRGISFVQIPTSLLAMVDSSVGGKTGINLKRGKNLVGAFWQPSLVLADINVLSTLPLRELRAGLAEVIKYGVIYDTDFFSYLEENIEKALEPEKNPEVITHIIRRSVEIKADVVRQDEREGGLRRILNFGHTIGHAIEAVGNYKRFIHGEAIAIGMIAASRITLAHKIGIWSASDDKRLEDLIIRAGLPTCIPKEMNAKELIDRTKIDKKALAGKVRYVLPTEAGKIKTFSDLDATKIESVLIDLGASS